MNKTECLLAYPPKKAARESAYCQRQCRARRRIEALRDAQSVGLSLADIEGGEPRETQC